MLDIGLEIHDKLSAAAGPANQRFDKALFFGVNHDDGELSSGVDAAGPQSTGADLALRNLSLAGGRLDGCSSALPAKRMVIRNLVSAIKTERHSNPTETMAHYIVSTILPVILARRISSKTSFTCSSGRVST